MRFRALYAAVARTFADQLRQDLADLQAGRQVIPRPLSPAVICQSTRSQYMWPEAHLSPGRLSSEQSRCLWP